VAKRAERLGERLAVGIPPARNSGLGVNLQERITYAYWLVFSRPPDNNERLAATKFFQPAFQRAGARAERRGWGARRRGGECGLDQLLPRALRQRRISLLN